MITAAKGSNGREDPRERNSERWELIRAATVERAHALRAQLLRDFATWLVKRPAAIVLRWSQSIGAWRVQRSAVRELQGLDNRLLHDMGIARSEIEYLVAGGDPERRLLRKAVARRAPCAASDAAKDRDAAIGRRAA